jgi:plasmid stabilization system protein ParE
VRRVVWTDSALEDLAGIRNYIGRFNTVAAQRIVTSSEKVVGLFPLVGRSIGGGCYE